MADAQNADPLEAAAAGELSETSSLSGASLRSSLDTLNSSIIKHRRENGRRYATLGEGKYILPDDELEQDRLDMQHHLWQLTWDGELCMCPKKNGANRVLDIGTGTGIWAMDYAEEHPEAKVIGVDLTPIQSGYVPSNCVFEIDDVEKEWTWSAPFDFVFLRHMNSSFASWEKVIAQAYSNLEPGGYIELQDNTFPIQCRDGTMPETSPVNEWSSLLMESTALMGRPVDTPSRFKDLLVNAGFEEVVEVKRIWPMNGWTKNEKLRELGSWSQACSLKGCEASALALFTNVLGWTREEVLVFCSGVRRDLNNTGIHAYWNIYSTFGKKPLKANTSQDE